MQITIHRGTHQIGGVVTEISTREYKVFIDIGENLPGNENNVLPDIDGLTTGDASKSALFITHYHGDHIGAINETIPEIKIYMGELARDIQIIKARRLSYIYENEKSFLSRSENIETIYPAKKVKIGDIAVTPFIVDHSAIDSFMFLIETDGKRILHTGDFRMHGFRGKGLIPTLEKYVGEVDILITEGTMLSRKNEVVKKEQDIFTEAKQYIDQNKYVFVLCSSTNIDRIAAFYKATSKSKYFICDRYQKDVLNIVQNKLSMYSDLYSFDRALVYDEKKISLLKEKGFCMLIRAVPKFKEIMNKFEGEKRLVIYSMWAGYLAEDSDKYKPFFDGCEVKRLHTSGHANKDTLSLIAKTVSPRIGIIPMHCENPNNFNSLKLPFELFLLQDGETLNL